MAQTELIEKAGGIFSQMLKALKGIWATLAYMGGDPERAERAILLSDAIPVTDTALAFYEEAIDRSKTYSTMILQFTQASGSLRYDITGRNPTAAGRGFQFASGGGPLTIRGAENIRNFRVIAETGQSGNFTAMLFKASLWNTERAA